MPSLIRCISLEDIGSSWNPKYAESSTGRIKTCVESERDPCGIAELKVYLLARPIAADRTRETIERLRRNREIDLHFLARSDGDRSSGGKIGAERIVDDGNTLRAGLRQFCRECQGIAAGPGGKKLVAWWQFGNAEISVFIGLTTEALLLCFSAVLQTLLEQCDRQALDRFAILLTNPPIDGAFRNQLEY